MLGRSKTRRLADLQIPAPIMDAPRQTFAGGVAPSSMPVNNAGLAGLAQTPDIQPERKGPGLRGFLADFAGYFGDQLAGSPMYARTKISRMDALREEQQRAEERRQSMQDWVEKQQWVRDNPPPKAPSEFDQALVAAGIDPASPEGKALYRERVEHLASPPRWVQLPNGQWGQIGGDAPSQPSGPPPEAVSELRANPNTAAQFDEIFGPGAAASVLGGASPGGSRPFP